MTTLESLKLTTDRALAHVSAAVHADRLRPLATALLAERQHLCARTEQLERIRELTRRVREAQRRYFAVRDKVTLREAQHLERQLDELLDPAPMLPGMEAPR